MLKLLCGVLHLSSCQPRASLRTFPPCFFVQRPPPHTYVLKLTGPFCITFVSEGLISLQCHALLPLLLQLILHIIHPCPQDQLKSRIPTRPQTHRAVHATHPFPGTLRPTTFPNRIRREIHPCTAATYQEHLTRCIIWRTSVKGRM